MNKTDAIKGYLSLGIIEPSAVATKVGCTPQMVNYVKRSLNVQSHTPKDSVVGFFTDLHEPACHPRFFDFVQDTCEKHNVTTYVMGGDLVDHHFISRHRSETDALSPVDELELAIKHLEKWTKAFPEVLCCIGNHDSIPYRQGKELGIPKQFLRTLNDLYRLPDTWVWKDSHEVDGVLYNHGVGASGMYGCKAYSLAVRQSVCVGHSHSYGGVLYTASPKDIIFGLNGGCGMDTDSYAARYGEVYKYKPTLGMGIIRNGKEAQFIPMDMDKYRR